MRRGEGIAVRAFRSFGKSLILGIVVVRESRMWYWSGGLHDLKKVWGAD